MTNGTTINLSDLPTNYYLAAEVNGNVESVELILNNLPQNCENIVPYTFPNGANEINDGGWNGGTGSYTISARAYAVDGCNGQLCDEVTVSFSINQDCDDFTVDAGDPVTICEGESVTLSAVVEGATECDCCVRTVSNTHHCSSGQQYVLWLDGEHFRGNSDLVWEECGDGTARLTGTATKAGTTYTIDITYSGYSTSTPAGSPKDNNCVNVNTNGWVYYTDLTGTLTSGNVVYTLTRRGPSFQLGNGANQTAPGFGGSGWFDATRNGHTIVGDINIMLSQNCSSGAGCSAQNVQDMTYIGAYGNSHYYMKSSGDLTYWEAVNFVQSRGGNLPKIETSGENAWLASQITGSIWLGLSDDGHEGTWKWYDGETAIYTNWADHEPSNNHGEDFARMRPDGYWTDRGENEWFWVVMEVECSNQGGGGINEDISYLWTPGNYTTPSITVSPSSTTTYTVQVTGCDGCVASDNVTVTVDGGFECPPDVDIECDESSDPDNTGYPTLDCDPDAVFTYEDERNGMCPEIITRTWTASVTRTIDDPCIPREIAHWNFANAYTLGCGQNKEPLDVGIPPSSTDDTNCSAFHVSDARNDDGSSCVKGVFGSAEAAICVSASPESTFKNNDDDAIMFTVNFGAQDEGRLTKISFFERVEEWNENFGQVDYARKFGVRVLKNGSEIYKVVDINTSNGHWQDHEFDFSNDPDFSYSGATEFKFEILGYHPTNNGHNKKVWEFDELKVFGCCGTETTNETIEFTCTQTIRINDTTPPVVTGPADITINCDEELPDPTGQATASDNCSFTTAFMEEVLDGPFTCPVIGQVRRTWTATDDCGNQDEHVQIISIVDNTPPFFDGLVPDEIISCDDPIEWGEPAFLDNCDDNVEISFEDVEEPGDCPQQKVITRTWTIVDDCDNTAQTSAKITIVDEEAPEVTCDPDSETIECAGLDGNQASADNWNTENIAKLENCSSDNCGAVEVTSNYDFGQLNLDCGLTGTLTVTYTISDECGNELSKQATFTIVDTTDPVLTCDPDDESIECEGYTGNVAAATAWNAANISKLENCASDDCGQIEVTSNFDYDDLLDPDCGLTGSITVTYTISDDCDNEITRQATFTIVDTTDPVVTCDPDDRTVECDGETGNAALAAAWNAANIAKLEACSSDICGDVEVTSDFNFNQQYDPACGFTGSLTVTYTITDDCGNDVTKQATFTIEDTTDPVVSCDPDDRTVECEGEAGNAALAAAWNAANIAKLEACSSDICGDVEVTSNFDYDQLLDPACGFTGSLTVTYTITDDCGNDVTKQATFTIVDTTDPVVSCDPDDRTAECEGEAGNAALAAAWNVANIAKLEACSSDICGDVEVTSDFNFSQQYDPACGFTGSLTVTYTITDDCGNDVTKQATFIIVDTTDPEVTCDPDDRTVECDGEAGNAALAAAWNAANIAKLEGCSSDICGDVEVTSNFNYDQLLDPACGFTGSLTVTYTITDDCGNDVTKQATFTIVDTTDPVVTCDPDDRTVECEGETGNAALAAAWNAANIAKLEACSSDICGDVEVTSNFNFNQQYDPACGFTGSLTVTYTITDDCGNDVTKQATFTN